MTAVDEAIARFTSFTQSVLDQLKSAQDKIQELIDLDELEDALQAEQLKIEIADKINAAVDALQRTPEIVEEGVEPETEEL